MWEVLILVNTVEYSKFRVQSMVKTAGINHHDQRRKID